MSLSESPAAPVPGPDGTGLSGVRVFGTGLFGRRVGELLAGPAADVGLPREAGMAAAFDAAPSAVVIALWRPSPALCERADALSHTTGVPWLPIVLLPSTLQVGPLVVPGSSPCFGCFEERRAQHDPQRATTAALFAAYDRDPRLGPRGFLPHHARTAAGLAQEVLRDPGASMGRVVTAPLQVSGHGGHADSAPVLACAGCPRCAPPAPARDLRALLRLRDRAPAPPAGHGTADRAPAPPAGHGTAPEGREAAGVR